jgi:hypothetical protein
VGRFFGSAVSTKTRVTPFHLADFRKLIPDETEKWDKVIRTSNMKAE